MDREDRLKRIVSLVMLLIVVVAIVTGIDYKRTTKDFEKPLFAMPTITADDGGSGTYRGLVYSIELEGNFMPEDEFPGVTRAEFYLFGKQIKEVLRD